MDLSVSWTPSLKGKDCPTSILYQSVYNAYPNSISHTPSASSPYCQAAIWQEVAIYTIGKASTLLSSYLLASWHTKSSNISWILMSPWWLTDRLATWPSEVISIRNERKMVFVNWTPATLREPWNVLHSRQHWKPDTTKGASVWIVGNGKNRKCTFHEKSLNTGPMKMSWSRNKSRDGMWKLRHSFPVANRCFFETRYSRTF